MNNDDTNIYRIYQIQHNDFSVRDKIKPTQNNNLIWKTFLETLLLLKTYKLKTFEMQWHYIAVI